MRVVIKFDEDGEVESVITDGPCDVYGVDEGAPADRVYLLSTAHVVGRRAVDEALGDSPVGHMHDDHPLSEPTH